MDEQYTFSDILNTKARSKTSYTYDTKWKNTNKCVFCDLKERYTIIKINEMVLTTNIYPYIDGHLMIIPTRHIMQIRELTTPEWDTVRMLHYCAQKMLKEIFGYKSLWILYREGSGFKEAQKTVEHLHIHLLPYKNDLVNWNYQEIKTTPFDLAATFKNNMDVFNILIERYNKKYANI